MRSGRVVALSAVQPAARAATAVDILGAIGVAELAAGIAKAAPLVVFNARLAARCAARRGAGRVRLGGAEPPPRARARAVRDAVVVPRRGVPRAAARVRARGGTPFGRTIR